MSKTKYNYILKTDFVFRPLVIKNGQGGTNLIPDEASAEGFHAFFLPFSFFFDYRIKFFSI